MALNNITRTNTIDEWRIQTNLAANALNQIETGNYNKTNGTFTISSNGALSIIAQGTALSVANGALFQSNISVGKDIVLGSEVSQTGNLSVGNTVYIYGQATALYVANNIIANGNLLVKNTITTNNITVNSNVVVVGTANAGYLGVANSGYVGTTLTVIGNTAVGNLTTANSVVADNARITSNVTATEITITTINATNARITANANVAHVTATGSIVADSARITANATVAHVVASGSIVADNARLTANATASEVTVTTINATNARITANANVAHVTATGSIVADNARLTANATASEVTVTTINGTNARISGNANVAHLTSSGSVVADSLRITSATASANISGNVVAGNVNTQGMVYAGSLVSGKTDVGALSATSLSTASDATIGGKLTVAGDFVLSGDIVYDTDVLSISTITPVTDTGAAYFGVFRGNDKGGVSGGSGGASANANAYIRWSASANNWQIRDVFNSDSTTTYSKILTANLITTSTASVSNNDFASSWLMKNYVDNANTNLKSYVDTSAIQTAAANAGALGITLSANIGAARIADVNTLQANTGAINISLTNEIATRQANVGLLRLDSSSALSTANTNLKNYVDVANTSMKSYVDIANTSMKSYVDTRTTANISEVTNLYYTDTRVRAAVGLAASFGAPLSYISSNGTFQHLNSGVSASTYGSSSQVPAFTVNATGHITAVTATSIAISSGAVSGLASSATTDTTNASNITTGILAATRLPALSGDITSTEGTSATTLATVNSTTGSMGSATHVSRFTVNGKGLITSANSIPIAISSGSVSGLASSATTDTTNASNISSGTLPAARFPAFTGDITTVAGGVATTLATVNSTTGTFGSSTQVPTFTVNGKGLITSVTATNISISSGSVSGLASSATTDTTNASNISSGTLNSDRLAYTFNQGVGTGSATRFASVAVGLPATTAGWSMGTGEIRATGDITAGYSDDKLKTKLGNIENALDKVSAISGFYYEPNKIAQDLGFQVKREVGVSAQEVQAILPEVVVPAPVDSQYLTVHYEKLIPLLIEAIKELKAEVDELKKK